VLVEVYRREDNDGFITGEWIVSLRHGHRTVVVGCGLGRFSADMLANELRAFLDGRSIGMASRPSPSSDAFDPRTGEREGGAID